MRRLKRVLVANRGEIAVRVIRACHEVGTEAVAVYSDADRGALHVRLADAAYGIGEARAAKSYLRIERLVEVAREAGCDGVHPGYGFLAENVRFAEAVEAAGIAFVGPTPAAMRRVGNKISARKEAIAAGVPVSPGGTEPIADEEDLHRRAEETGFPLILKAAGGGGGKGIRVVRRKEDLVSALRMAASEAEASFGNRDVFVEKFLENARHIEVQLLGDGHGNVVHLGERECSLQRRQQKLVEEAPSPSISEETRQAILESATALGKRIGYRSAGTMEFLLEGSGGRTPRFYFMEMNTRLQVEHPVTELVTGIDLVKEQLRIAAGEALGYDQSAVGRRGHAIEARINAEDPEHEFVPSAGTIASLHLPGGPGTRVDTALFSGDRVSLFYDPLIAKLIVWGRDRGEAIVRLRRALDELRISGVATSAPVLRLLVRSKAFESADFHIHFLERFTREALAGGVPEAALEQMAIAAAVHEVARRAVPRGAASGANGADGAAATAGGELSAWVRYGRAIQLGGLGSQ